MVLPSDDHVILRQWLATRGVDAGELAGLLVTGDLDALLAVSGSEQRLSPLDRQSVDEARAIARDSPMWPELSDLGTAACELRVTAVLERVCEAMALAGVPAQVRRPFLLHHVCGFSFAEIAARLGIEVGAAKVRSSRARLRLRMLLSGGTDGD